MNSSMIFKKKSPLLVFLIPAFLFMGLFLYYPFVMNIFNSFNNIIGLGTESRGLNDPWYKNYAQMMSDPQLGTAVLNTLLMMVLTIVFQVGIALLLAILIDNIRKGTQFFRIVYFFPIIISATALGLLFNLIFLYEDGGAGGMINQLITAFGGTPVNWKGDFSMFTMALPVMWQYIGFYFVIIVTGLNNICPDIYEAAAIDGANGFKRVRYITMPLLHNVLCTCLVLAITGALKIFDLPWTMFPQGMPMGKTYLTGTYMYYVTFMSKDVDYGSAIALLIVVLGVVISQIVNRVFKEKDY